MAQPASKHQMTYAEYLALEQTSQVKHEFVAGECFAMSGGTPIHGHLAMRLGGILFRILGRGPCRPYSSDTRVFLQRSGEGCYPDVSVICGRPQHDLRDAQGVINPTVVFEVLSPTTAVWDRGEKFARYQTLATLRDYVLVTTEHNRVEHFARNDDGSWTYRDLHDGDMLRLTGAPAEVAVSELYDGVDELRDAADAVAVRAPRDV